MRKLLVGIVLVVAVMIGAGPWLIGVWFHHQYTKMIAFYNAENSVHIDLMKYERHWLNTDAVLAVKIINPAFSRTLVALGIDQESLPNQFDFTLSQHIQHGPLVFRRFSPQFVLALVDNTIYFPAEFKKFLQTFALPLSITQQDYVTWAGNYVLHLPLSDIDLIYPEKTRQFKIKNLQTILWIQLGMPHVQGELTVDKLSYLDAHHSFSIPHLQLHFDQYRAPNGLWAGKTIWKINEIVWVAEDTPTIKLSDVDFSSQVELSGDSLWIRPYLSIHQLTVDDQVFSPIRLQISTKKLNATILLDMLAIYHEVEARGEFYQSELRQRLFFLLPKIAKAGTSIKLDKLDLTMPEGNLKITAGISWPNHSFIPAENVMELIDEGKVYAKGFASKTFVSHAIDFLSSFSYFRRVPEQALTDLMAMEKDIRIAMQRNAFLLASLVDQGQLLEFQGENLIALLRDDITGSSYPDEVKRLWQMKDISLQTAYLLYWNYAGIKNQVETYRDKIAQYHDAISLQMHKQFADWVKQGYIIENKKGYSFSVTREEEVLKVNGKKI